MPVKIVSIEETYTSDFVYDIENPENNYVCGVDNIVVQQSDSQYNKFAAVADVKYGDTDSIYTQFLFPDQDEMGKDEKLRRGQKVASECADRISVTFRDPIELENEKAMWPLYLYGKKRYACKAFEYNPKKDIFKEKNDYKGIQVVRRDNCKLVKTICNPVYKQLLDHNSVQGAIRVVHEYVEKLLKNELPIEEFVISATYNREYKIVPGHVLLAERMRERGVLECPNVGDRVPYVFIEIEGAKRSTPGRDRMEDPNYVREHPEKCKIDTLFYLEKQIASPLYTIFEIMVKQENGEVYPRRIKKDGTMEISKEAKAAIDELLFNDLVRKYKPGFNAFIKKPRKAPVQKNTLDSMLEKKSKNNA